MLQLRGDQWQSGPVLVARSFLQRLRGLVPRAGHGLLIKAKSVHGMGMMHSLQVVGLDAKGTVIAVRLLRPFGLVIVRHAVWILELPPEVEPPVLGQTIAVG